MEELKGLSPGWLSALYLRALSVRSNWNLIFFQVLLSRKAVTLLVPASNNNNTSTFYFTQFLISVLWVSLEMWKRLLVFWFLAARLFFFFLFFFGESLKCNSDKDPIRVKVEQIDASIWLLNVSVGRTAIRRLLPRAALLPLEMSSLSGNWQANDANSNSPSGFSMNNHG